MSRMLDLGAVTVMVVGGDRQNKHNETLEGYVNAVLGYMHVHDEATLQDAITATRETLLESARNDPNAPEGFAEKIDGIMAGLTEELHEIVQEARDMVALVDGRVKA